MNRTAHEDSTSEQLPPKVITERNWQEFRNAGWLIFRTFGGDNPPSIEDLVAEETYWGKDNVCIGDAYDLGEKRPLSHKPGVAFYIGPDALEYAEIHHPDEPEPQSSSGTGPASS